jgi:hypothetical protein
MKLNCKPGDLAYVIDMSCSANIGRVLEVISRGADGEYGPEWRCQCKGYVVAWDEALQQNVYATPGTKVYAPDAHLRPITGLSITDDIKDEVTA